MNTIFSYLSFFILAVYGCLCVLQPARGASVGVSPGIIDVEIQQQQTIEKEIHISQSDIQSPQEYTVHVQNTIPSITILYPDHLTLLPNQQEQVITVTIETDDTALGTYSPVLQFSPETAKKETEAQITTALGLSVQMNIQVVQELSAVSETSSEKHPTSAPPTPTNTNAEAITAHSFIQRIPLWIFYLGAALVWIDIAVVVYMIRKRKQNTNG